MYEYLRQENGPKLLIEGLKWLGTKEFSGDKNNDVIINWAKELDLEKTYNADSIPWCGLFIAKIVKDTGREVVKNPLWARNWLNFGTKVNEAMLADILVFQRPQGGHVGLYVGEDSTCYHVLGGNQGDEVSIVRILKSRCIGIRRPIWKIAQPANVRKIILGANLLSNISNNEA